MNDLERLRNVYAEREHRLVGRDIYSYFNMPYLFIIQQRQHAIFRFLRRYNFTEFEDYLILEMGCGMGGVLVELLQLEADPRKIFGVDILQDKLTVAHNRLPESPLINADGQNLPFRGSKFDLVLQFTAFSSVLDEQVKKNMASEMLRVLKPGGLILWYDFWLNPFNKQTKGIRKPEIRRLFPGCSFEFHKITLAPPLARRLVPVSWILCMILEKLKVLNTHYLVGIRKDVIRKA